MTSHVSFDLDFKRNPYKGLYIAIEGIDGSGKSTQAEAVRTYFEEKGRRVILTGEPNDELVIGKFIRKILSQQIRLPSKAYQAIYSADRSVNHAAIVEPALRRGDVVISHRTFWSVIPYGIRDIGKDTYDRRNAQLLMVAQGMLSHFHQFIVSDKTFYLDVSVDTVLKRLSVMEKEKDIYENREKLATIAKGYQWLVERFPKEIVRIDGEQLEQIVTEEILRKIEDK